MQFIWQRKERKKKQAKICYIIHSTAHLLFPALYLCFSCWIAFLFSKYIRTSTILDNLTIMSLLFQWDGEMFWLTGDVAAIVSLTQAYYSVIIKCLFPTLFSLLSLPCSACWYGVCVICPAGSHLYGGSWCRWSWGCMSSGMFLCRCLGGL